MIALSGCPRKTGHDDLRRQPPTDRLIERFPARHHAGFQGIPYSPSGRPSLLLEGRVRSPHGAIVSRLFTALVAVLVLIPVLAAGLALAGAARWSRDSRRAGDRLLAREWADDAPDPGRGGTDGGDAVPDPVRRYLDRSAPARLPTIRVARIQQTGQFLLRPPDGWAPFTATQLFTGTRPGLLWDARVRMAPLLQVHVRDRYGTGHGSMRGAVAGLVPVVDTRGGGALAEAAAMRYLAEAVWLPTRLRPGGGLRWTPVSDSVARATLVDGTIRTSLEFTFDEEGDIVSIRSDRRFRGEDEEPRWAPWVGRCEAYQDVGGYRIPGRCTVAWVIDGEERPYWKGRVDAVVYEYGPGLTTTRWPSPPPR